MFFEIWCYTECWGRYMVKKKQRKNDDWLISAAVLEGVVSGSRRWTTGRRTDWALVGVFHLQTTITRSKHTKEENYRSVRKKQICSPNEILKYEVKKTYFCISKGCSVPDNLEDVADSSFFLWNVKAIWSRPWQEVLLATIVWYKLQHQEKFKWRLMNYTHFSR